MPKTHPLLTGLAAVTPSVHRRPVVTPHKLRASPITSGAHSYFAAGMPVTAQYSTVQYVTVQYSTVDGLELWGIFSFRSLGWQRFVDLFAGVLMFCIRVFSGYED